MRRLMWAMPMLVFVPALWAFDDPKDKPQDKPATPAEEFRAIKLEFDTARLESAKASREAKTDEEKKEAREKAPDPQEFAAKFMDLAKKYPQDAVAIDALMWVVSNLRTGAEVEKAIDELFKSHIDSDKLGVLIPVLGNARSGRPNEPRLRMLLEKSPHRIIQGQACFSLAQLAKQRADAVGRQKNPAAEKAAKDAETLFEQVVEKYGDVQYGRGTLGAAAEGDLFELRFLSVGKIAPDIEAEDLDSETFKLSDYRGKVVMIDFWGHW